jgi:signal transduction histidine kinase
MSGAPSLRARLTRTLFVTLALVLALFSLVPDRAFSRALWRQMDERLESEASAIAGMVEANPGEPTELEYSPLPQFAAVEQAAYFEVWLPDGTVLARSPSLRGRDLPRVLPTAAITVLFRATLPDGRSGRALQMTRTSAPVATVVVARGTEEIDSVLRRLRLWLGVLGTVALAAAALAARLAVSRGLRPAERLAEEIAQIGEKDLRRTLDTRGVPGELLPMVAKLNELLLRLDQAFARERRVTADVSHELRTPLAAARTILEVATSRDRPAAEYRLALEETRDVVLGLHGLVENLLLLTRLEAGQMERHPQPIALHALVTSGWAPLQARAAAKGLRFSNELDKQAQVQADEAALRLILANLLDNAVEYTAPGGAIAVRQRAGSLLEVWDSGPPIPAEALPRLFERFFRADPARSGGSHCGIGLTLVRSLADIQGLTVTPHNEDDGSVCFRLSRMPR